MADAMDLVQQRVEEERQRHIRAARAKRRACPACFALSVKRQFRQHAAVPFRVCSFALPVRKSQS